MLKKLVEGGWKEGGRREENIGSLSSCSYTWPLQMVRWKIKFLLQTGEDYKTAAATSQRQSLSGGCTNNFPCLQSHCHHKNVLFVVS